MEFRNPKMGEIYAFEGKDCVTSGFCDGIPCHKCPIRDRRDAIGIPTCREYVTKNPNAAARLMGYEVIEDDIPAPEYARGTWRLTHTVHYLTHATS